jgi:hypothetical protein
LGLSRLPIWSGAICPLAELIAWGIGRRHAPADYDMKHALFTIGFVFAIASAIAWLGGRAIASWVRWSNEIRFQDQNDRFRRDPAACRGSRRQAVIVAASPALLPARALRARRRLLGCARETETAELRAGHRLGGG